jgi:peptide/nickel transport system permease protein
VVFPYASILLIPILSLLSRVTTGGYDPSLIPGWSPDFIGDAIYHSILPAVTIVISSISGWMLGMRNAMVTTLSEDYVLMAEAKGLPQWRIICTYAARNAILPNVAGFALALGFVISGQLLTEVVFSYPGIGFSLLKAVQQADYALMQGIFLLITIAVLAANLFADLLYVLLDPRARQERGVANMDQFSSLQDSAADPNDSANRGEAQTTVGAATVSSVVGASLPSDAVPMAQGRLGNFWKTLMRNKKVLIGMIIVAIFVLVAIFGPLLVQGDPNAVTEEMLQPPSATHLLGTTDQGQDVFAQLMVGTRSSMFWGMITGVLVTALSVIVGLVGGYAGGVIDEILSLVSNVFLILPALPLAIIMAAYFPVKGESTVAFVIVITSWSWQARVLRAQTLSMRNRDFVMAARACGESPLHIIFFEILPNELAIIVAGFISTVIYVILAAAGLQFLGLGNSADVNWGTMFYRAQNSGALVAGAWWWFLPPGIGVALLGTALALVNLVLTRFRIRAYRRT